MTSDAEDMLLRVQTPSRKRPKPGDLFRIVLENGWVYFGHVVRNDVSLDFLPRKFILICIYADRFALGDEPDPKSFSLDRLLIEPDVTNRLPWSRGYFETVMNTDPAELGFPPRFCFENPLKVGPRYMDEYGSPIEEPFEPIGFAALASYASIDERVRYALGFPLINAQR